MTLSRKGRFETRGDGRKKGNTGEDSYGKRNKAMLVTGAARALGLRAEAALHELPIEDHPAILLPRGNDIATGDELIAAMESLGPSLAKHGPVVLVVALANGRVEYASMADAAPAQIDVGALARSLTKLGLTKSEVADAMDAAIVTEVMLE